MLYTQYGCLKIVYGPFGEEPQAILAGFSRSKIFSVAAFGCIKFKYLFIDIPFELADSSLEIIIRKLNRNSRCIGLEISYTIFEIDFCIDIRRLESYTACSGFDNHRCGISRQIIRPEMKIF